MATKREKNYKILDIDPYIKPYAGDIRLRMDLYDQAKKRLLQKGQSLRDFASGSLYYGFHRAKGGWTYREWAPNATAMHLIGDFNGWDRSAHPMTQLEDGDWELFVPGEMPHGSLVKVQVTADGRDFDRIPLYANRVVQDPTTGAFDAVIWAPKRAYRWHDKEFLRKKTTPPLVYECHIGMATEEEGIGSYAQFTKNILPRIQKEGYNTIQLMAIMEHPYYGSFGYQVSNFFAASSKYGTPEELKKLIDTAHSMGITVLLDLIHSHAVRNTSEGINCFDGTEYQFFHAGAKGDHPAWGTKLFDYGKDRVLHFLLSNIRYWMEEYHFDGFRFDGVTSMLYHHHGLGVAFDSYDKYFSMDTDVDAVTYLQLANQLIHEIDPAALTVAEDMSGMPGTALPVRDGGLGFDYRLSMGVPDFWINTLKTQRDEQWDMGRMWYELTTRRPKEKNIGYCESHDQALVGDKTIIFWLADQEMYWHMDKASQSIVIDRAIALHKMIRLVSFSLAGEGYLNFMGNEFGHPEWIDFPREGNNWSYKYARRQWSLADNGLLRYGDLLAFDTAMLGTLSGNRIFGRPAQLCLLDQDRKLLCYQKGNYLFICNFHPTQGQNAQFDLPAAGTYTQVLSTDDVRFGGFDELCGPAPQTATQGENNTLQWVLPPRTAVVLRKKGGR
ncbi:alpha amylase C-terminal domain-containing protein [Neobittarella massiliensis]|uniref:alpha amylase C-terminal domain-containing protein n=1 Tax=Neobittarella massiliensis (ex Bilen et al. 2018) TaxID=2041842 RepID=UPI001FB2716E|nr:alpha amylase C-terminal domain-containing protein [Neobittarella massiliensis]